MVLFGRFDNDTVDTDMVLTGNAPIFESIAAYFRRMIHRGFYKPGDALPSVREVALSERINPNTVVRAYGLLVEEGLIVTIPKKGYFVAEDNDKERAESLKETLHALLKEGYGKEEIISALQNMEVMADD